MIRNRRSSVASALAVALAMTLLAVAPRVSFAATVPSPLKLSPGKLNLGKQVLGTVGGTSAPKIVTLANKGTVPIAISGIAVQGDFALAPAGSTCGASLAPAAKCALAITFTPSALGARAGHVIVSDDALGSPHLVALKGSGVAGALLFTPSSLAFSPRAPGASGPTRSLSLHNPNTVPLRLTGIAVSGDDFAIASRTCGSVLGAGADCSIDVGFVPLGSGARKGKLRVGAHAARSPKTVALKGKGLGKCKAAIPNLCNDVCTNVLDDEDNCGGCENFCPGTCIDGRCEDATISCRAGSPDLCTCGSGTACVDFLSDPANCGGCGNACFVGQHCDLGICTGCTSLTAPDECGTQCSNFQVDPLNCGACGAACASGLCVNGECLSCTVDAPTKCSGVCADVLTDAANCGGCGNVCPSGTSCVAGQCAGIVCGGATPDLCGNRCVNLATDADHCGSCPNACASNACVQGQCVQCGGGTPDRCGTTCTAFATDDANCGACGNVCPAGSSCSGGTCVGPACLGLQAIATARVAAGTEISAQAAAVPCGGEKPDLCGTECVNFQTDSFHCGNCDTFCPSGKCVSGSCIECTGSTPTRCGTTCVDLFNDSNNCGGCGVGCGSDACVGGICQHGVDCNGVKKNTNIDPKNCGSCGHVCPDGPCVGGTCRKISCPQSYEIVCDGVCVDKYSDSRNCGVCGNVCLGNLVCGASFNAPHGAGCSLCSDPTPDDCNGLCVRLNNDPDHCGTCDTKCAADEECSGGHCSKCINLLQNSTVRCGEWCTLLDRDAKNCGACGTSCGEGAFCFQSQCAKCSEFAPTQCGTFGNKCTNLQLDAKNCGACDHACEKGQKCEDGKCKGCVTSKLTAFLAPPAALEQCFEPCDDPTPDACGTTCVNTRTDPNNCGGCGNSCGPSLSCVAGECDPGFCGSYKATTWSGGVDESSTDVCGDSASLALGGGESLLVLTPSTTVPGGCDVGGGINLVQQGAICGVWGGPWTCGGLVDADGGLSLGCSCGTSMSAEGGALGAGFSGDWTFFASGHDENGDSVTDSGAGSFVLERVSP